MAAVSPGHAVRRAGLLHDGDVLLGFCAVQGGYGEIVAHLFVGLVLLTV
jgi:hypothetical protein